MIADNNLIYLDLATTEGDSGLYSMDSFHLLFTDAGVWVKIVEQENCYKDHHEYHPPWVQVA